MITADRQMYVSKRAGKNRVTGVPVMATSAELAADGAPLIADRGTGGVPAATAKRRSRARKAPAGAADESV
jgi:hypothetical protein